MSRSVTRESAVGSAIGVLSTFAVAIIAERIYTRLRHGRGEIAVGAKGYSCWPVEEGWERPTGPGVLERDPDQSVLRVTRDGEPPPWWVEFCEYPSESSFSAPLTRTAGLALNNGWFEPGGYRALLERFIVGEIQRRAEAEPNHDWRLKLYSSHGTATFQRYDKDAWRQIGFEARGPTPP
ncbi:MAG: hypothetical protein ACXVII_44640 [Solirubrobacteraceae bacterium]